MPTRSEGAMESNTLPAAIRTLTASPIARLRSSNNKDTNRCGRTTPGVRSGSAAGASGLSETETTETGCEPGVSMLKVEMVCGLRLSDSTKSSFFKFSTTLPCSSRTTTRTSTRFTRTLNVVEESLVTTSAGAVYPGLSGVTDGTWGAGV